MSCIITQKSCLALLNLRSIPLTFPDFTPLMCSSHGVYWKSPACHTYPSICYYYLNCIGKWQRWIGNGAVKLRPPQPQYFRHSSASVSLADWDAAGSLPFSASCFLSVSLVLLSPKQTFWWKAKGDKMFRKARHMRGHTHSQSTDVFLQRCGHKYTNNNSALLLTILQFPCFSKANTHNSISYVAYVQ